MPTGLLAALVAATKSNSDNFALLRLFSCGVGNDALRHSASMRAGRSDGSPTQGRLPGQSKCGQTVSTLANTRAMHSQVWAICSITIGCAELIARRTIWRHSATLFSASEAVSRLGSSVIDASNCGHHNWPGLLQAPAPHSRSLWGSRSPARAPVTMATASADERGSPL